jgi:H+/Cl- antiporter ClcA
MKTKIGKIRPVIEALIISVTISMFFGSGIWSLIGTIFPYPKIYIHLDTIFAFAIFWSVLTYSFCGVYVGWRAKRKGWLFGLISCIGLYIIQSGLFKILISYARPFPFDATYKPHILVALFFKFQLPLYTIIGVVGGIIGEYLSKRKIKIHP